MPVPNHQQVIDAMSTKGIPFECRSCGDASQLKMDVAGLALTSLGAAAVNQSVSSTRFTPMALLTCGACGETRLFHLERLGFRAPY